MTRNNTRRLIASATIALATLGSVSTHAQCPNQVEHAMLDAGTSCASTHDA